MEPDRRRHQISDLYHGALDRKPAERDAFLKEACDGDEALRREIESLLQVAVSWQPPEGNIDIGVMDLDRGGNLRRVAAPRKPSRLQFPPNRLLQLVPPTVRFERNGHLGGPGGTRS